MKRLSSSPSRGFTLVEVLLSLGIIAFCMGAILGLIPTGLASQKNARDQERAVAALNRAVAAAGSIKFQSRDSSGNAVFKLPEYFTGTGSPATFTVGDSAWSCTFQLGEDGLLHQSNDPVPARQTLHLRVTPPTTEAAPLLVYAAVVWPAKPSDSSASTLQQLKGRQGTVDALIAQAPQF